MSSFTVIKATKQDREPVLNGSTFHSYLVELKHLGQVEMLVKPGNVPSGTIEGEIIPGKAKNEGGKWPDRLKRTKQAGGFSRSPDETKRIVRQHSQDMAIKWGLDLDAMPLKTLDQLKAVINWFDADVYSIGGDIPSKASIEPPKRNPAPEIPYDEAKGILVLAQAAGLANGMELEPSLKAKLTALGVESCKLGDMNTDQAEEVKSWIKNGNP